MTGKRARNTGYLALVGLFTLILVAGIVSAQPYGSLRDRLIRGAALLGYLAVCMASVSSAYTRQLVHFFGRPFVKVHHVLSVTGLILITLHPLGVAWSSASTRVLLPRFDSWLAFLRWGGPPAWYLIAAASLAAALRKAIGHKWRVIHALNYVAFLLATVHAAMIGTDLQNTAARALLAVLVLVVNATFVQRRRQRRRR